MGIQLFKAGNANFRIYEKPRAAAAPGAKTPTPNVACDVFAQLRLFFEPNPEWGWRFARGEEIQRYLERCERKYGPQPYIEYNCEIDSARWDGQQWLIRTRDGCDDHADAGLRRWRPAPPALPGDSRYR